MDRGLHLSAERTLFAEEHNAKRARIAAGADPPDRLSRLRDRRLDGPRALPAGAENTGGAAIDACRRARRHAIPGSAASLRRGHRSADARLIVLAGGVGSGRISLLDRGMKGGTAGRWSAFPTSPSTIRHLRPVCVRDLTSVTGIPSAS